MILINPAGHITSTKSQHELNTFAGKLGLTTETFKPPSRNMVVAHYTLISHKKRRIAKMSGAKLVNYPDFVDRAFWVDYFLKERR